MVVSTILSFIYVLLGEMAKLEYYFILKFVTEIGQQFIKVMFENFLIIMKITFDFHMLLSTK